MKKKALVRHLSGKDWEKSFNDIQTMVLTIGFPHSGSSLIGYLLTAHPNIVIADEPYVGVKEADETAKFINKIKLGNRTAELYSADLNKMFDVILSLDYARWLEAQELREKDDSIIEASTRQKRYILVPNQYQGRFEALKVIGVKRSRNNVIYLSRDNLLGDLQKKLAESKIRLKFIFTVRNLYDMATTMQRKRLVRRQILAREWERKRNESYIKEKTKIVTTEICNENRKILEKVRPQDVFISKHEDMIANPKLQLEKLCDFLGVSAPSDYLDDCASQIVGKANKSRHEFDWMQEQKQEFAALIERYDFFAGYDWES